MKKGNAKLLSIFHIRDLFNLEISKDYGLTYHEISALDYLKNKGKTSQSNLVKRLRLDKSSVTKIVNKLEVCGYITRDFDREDLRHKVLTPTDKLMNMNLPLISFTDVYFEAIMKDFSHDEMVQAYSLISRMYKNAKEMQDDKFSPTLKKIRNVQSGVEEHIQPHQDEYY